MDDENVELILKKSMHLINQLNAHRRILQVSKYAKNSFSRRTVARGQNIFCTVSLMKFGDVIEEPLYCFETERKVSSKWLEKGSNK